MWNLNSSLLCFEILEYVTIHCKSAAIIYDTINPLPANMENMVSSE
jgi:hypothetical protein